MARQDYDKIVKLACKPKNAPPKAKYLDALIAGTFDEHSLQDISRALAMRVRDGNPVVVFKALITIHKLMQTGSAENLLAHLGRNESLRLRDINVQGDAGGVRVPSNVSAYGYYLDARIRAYRELRHDLFFLQTESNRRSTGLGANSKARRLRHLPVDKGLLREVKQVQRILDAMVRCTFYDDNLSDENTVLAFRMVIKDMLVFFQAGNEGVCNILEHYFEMSKVDATDSFEIYKNFIKQTDKVVDFLAMARRLNNVVNVPVPNLKHAPTSLVKALEEYLNDPNFEQNRIEYKRSLGIVEGTTGRTPSPRSAGDARKTPSSPSAAAAKPASPAPATASSSSGAPQKIQDFLDSIQPEAQPTIFGGPATTSTLTGSGMQNQFQVNQFGAMGGGMMPGQMGTMPTGQHGMMPGQFGAQTLGHPQQQQPFGMPPMHLQQPLQMHMTGSNPFRQSMFPEARGGGLGGSPGAFLGPQMTGFPQGQQQPFMQPQPTGFLQPQSTGFLQPQTTGSNPFRQSTLGPLGGMATGPGGGMFHSQPVSPVRAGSAALPRVPAFHDPPVRSNSVPIAAAGLTASPKALAPQKTGSNNPFAPPGGIPSPPPPQPKMPTMNELAHNRMQQQYAMMTGMGGGQMETIQQQQQQAPPASSAPATSSSTSLDPFAPTTSTAANGSTAMSEIASAFALDTKLGGSTDFNAQFGGLTLGSAGASGSPTALKPQNTGFLQPQRTGYAGSTVKPFKPTSSFGMQFMETLPPIPEPGGGTPASNGPSAGLSAQATGFPGMQSPQALGNGSLSPQPQAQIQQTTGAAFSGSGMSPSATGAGATPFGSTPGLPFHSNPSPVGSGGGSGGLAQPAGLHAQPTGFQPSSSFGQNLVAAHPAPMLQPQATGSNPFRASMMFGAGPMGPQPTGAPGGPGAPPFGTAAPFGQPQQQAGAQASLFS